MKIKPKVFYYTWLQIDNSLILIYIYFVDFLKGLPKGLIIKKIPTKITAKPIVNQTPEAIKNILLDSKLTKQNFITINKNQLKPITSSSTKMFSKYKLIPAKSKLDIQPSVGLSITGVGGTPMMLPMINQQKTKMLPLNQSVQLKSTSGNSQIMTNSLKSPDEINTQLFDVKSQQPNKQQIIPQSTFVSSNQTKLNDLTILNKRKFTSSTPNNRDFDSSTPDFNSTIQPYSKDIKFLID